MCGETHQCPTFFYARIYEDVAKTSDLSPEEVAIAGKLVKLFINSFRYAIMLLSSKNRKLRAKSKYCRRKRKQIHIPICSIFKPWKVFK